MLTRRVLVVGFAAATMVATACSSSKSSSTTTTAAPSATTATTSAAATTPTTAACSPGATATSIKIGLINWISGNPAYASYFHDGTAGAQARIDSQNAAGGVNGRTLSLDVGDDGGDPTMNLATARRLVEADNIFSLIEFPPSASGSGAYLQQKGIPVTGWETSPPDYATRPNFFAYSGPVAGDSVKNPTNTNALFLKQHGVTNVAFFAGPPPAAIAVSQADEEGVKAAGMTVGFSDLGIAPGTGDFTADAAKTKASGANGFITELDPITAVNMLKALVQAGLSLKGIFTTYDARLVAAYATQLQGDFVGTEFAPLELNLPGHQLFKADMAKYEPSAYVGQLALIGWLSADLMIQGLQALGSACPNRAALISAIAGIHNYDGHGLLNPIDFSKDRNSPKLCLYYSVVQGKGFTPVSDKPFCGQAVTPSQ